MRNVLYVAYHFPPLGGAGVQRTLKFVKHLPSFGYRPIVVTGRGVAETTWTPSDRSLLDEVPSRTRILRVPGREPVGPTKWAHRAERWLRVPSRWARWWLTEAVSTALSAAADEHVDLVYATAWPYESLEAGRRVAAELGVPWVAGVRDPWALDEMVVYPSTLHRRLELRRMKRVLSRAAAVIVTAEQAEAEFRRVLGSSAPVVTIPNGFDGDEFPIPMADSRARRAAEVFTIVHTGHFHQDHALWHRRRRGIGALLGGDTLGVDILPRSHVFLLDALDLLFARRPELRGLVRLELAGALSDAELELTHGRDYVVCHGYLPHTQSTDLVRSADALFLPMQSLEQGARARSIPGKLFEYLASGRPIIAAVPEGDARDLVLRSGQGEVCAPDDAEAMSAVIERLYDAEPAHPWRNAEFVDRFERRRLTAELAGVFDDVLRGRSGGTQEGDDLSELILRNRSEGNGVER